jgi:transcription elongation factor GreA
MSENNFVYLTRSRLVELENELKELKTKGRVEIAQKIAEAREHGDLTENAEYETAKQDQELLEIRINRLEQTLIRARIIDERDLPNDKVYILSTVKVRDLLDGKEFEYKLVSPEEADFEANKISVTSPIGKALLGKNFGDMVTVAAPAGTLRYTILEIRR